MDDLVDQMNGFVEQLQMRQFSNRNCIFVFPVFFMLLIISFENLSRGETRPPRGTAYTEMGRSLLRRSLKMRQSRQRSIQPGDVIQHTDLALAKSVEIIAHRGASHDAPENTLSSVNLAWKRDADAFWVHLLL